MGLEGASSRVVSLPLGSGEATLFEMVRAYSVFPNQVNWFIRSAASIEDKRGQVIIRQSEAHQVLSPEAIYDKHADGCC
jgi:membrane carboxypeptidase/penicillin-binding protein